MDEIGSVAGDYAGVTGALNDIGRASKSVQSWAPDVGPLGGIADLASGAGKVLHWDDQGQWDPNHGGWGDMINGGLSLAEGPLKMTPGLGPALGGGAQAITNGIQAANTFQRMSLETDPVKRAALERQAWGSTGDATIGALHAGLGSWCPVAEAYISAGELVLDGAGTLAGWAGGSDAKFGAGDVVGGLLDAVIPEEEDAWSNQAGNWVNRQVGGGTTGLVLGAAAGGVTNLATAPINIADAAAGGIVNTIGNIFDRDTPGTEPVREDYWGQFKGATATAAGNAWSSGTQAVGNAWNSTTQAAGNAWNSGTQAVGNAWNSTTQAAGNAWNSGTQAAGNAWNSTTQAAGNAWNSGTQAAGNAWNATTSAVGNAANTVGNAAGTAWNATTNAAGNAANAVGTAASDTWNTVTSW